ncbi:hypothetical protein KKA95_00625 [Patescibacteria group bacterium]|nr:hypothetical protein [Patescibacteria group bacterium]
MQFSYTALSSDNQKLTGVLEAESLEAAQSNLHKMGVAIIAINEISEEEFTKQKETEKVKRVETGIATFTFEATDPNGKDINGTIDAKDGYAAYKRLIIDYHFKINALYPIDATDADKTASKQKIDEWKAMLKEEGVEVKDVRGRGELELESEQIDQKIVKEIDGFIINSKKVLSEHKDKFSPEFFRQIEKTLGELERIRTSNNLKHISEVCNQLYELISHPDQMAEIEGVSDKSYQGILESMGGSAIIGKQFDLHSKAVGFKKIRSLFNKIMGKLRGESKKELKLQKSFEGEEKPASGIMKWFKGLTKKKSPTEPKPAKEGVSFMDVIKKTISLFSAPNAVLRKTRKQELADVYRKWRGPTKKPKPLSPKLEVSELKQMEEPIGEQAEEQLEEKKSGFDFTSIFVEIDSFLGWLLFFYISFLFLVNFSLEKGIGIPRDFIIKTFKTPLIIDITIFLLFAHLLFKLKTQYFRKNFVGTLFLLFFGFGLYTLLVINF